MKIRNDFVTNSSSSSFILAFDNKEDGYKEIAAMTSRYGSDYVFTLLNDFDNEPAIPYDDLFKTVESDLESDAYTEICYGHGSWWSNDKDTFKKRWEDAHPNAKYSDFYDSEEFKAEKERVIKRLFDELIEKIGSRHYLVELEYEDHSIIGSELEHEILPYCDFTIRRFSHH